MTKGSCHVPGNNVRYLYSESRYTLNDIYTGAIKFFLMAFFYAKPSCGYLNKNQMKISS